MGASESSDPGGCRMKSRTIAIDEIGSITATPGSRPWAVAMRRSIQAALHDTCSKAEHLHNMLRLFEQHHGHEALEDDCGRRFRSYEAFCTTKPPSGLGYRRQAIDRIVSERKRREAKDRAEAATALLEHGKNTKETLQGNVSEQGN